jgi:hypothetical protein
MATSSISPAFERKMALPCGYLHIASQHTIKKPGSENLPGTVCATFLEGTRPRDWLPSLLLSSRPEWTAENAVKKPKHKDENIDTVALKFPIATWSDAIA